jgi:branched-chain amino acid transport system substrate-binding protein
MIAARLASLRSFARALGAGARHSLRGLVAVVIGVILFGLAPSFAADDLPARIKIGVFQNLTGGGGPGDAATSMGVKLAIKELQDRGGTLAGRPVDFVYADTATDPTQTVSEAKRLTTQENIHAAIGPDITVIAMAAAPILTEKKIVSIGTAAGSQFTASFAPYHINNYYNTKATAKAMADFVADFLKLKNGGIIRGNGATDKASAEDFTAAMQARGLAIVADQSHEFQAMDMTPQLIALRRANPDFLYHQDSTVEGFALMHKTLADIGWEVPVLSTGGAVFTAPLLKMVGPNLFKDHVIWSNTFKANTACKNDPLGASPFAKFLVRLKAFDPPNYDRLSYTGSGQRYDAAQFLFAAIEGAKSVDGDKLIDWMSKNSGKFAPIMGPIQPIDASNHIMWGADAIGMVRRPDVRREDGLVLRDDC